MISRRTRVQLIAFVLLASVGIAYVGAKYAGLLDFFGTTTYTVSVQLPESGGIFENAEVTYRGVEVGRVGSLRPTSQGVTVDLKIRKGQDRIPSDGLLAEVKNLSAVGELYVDLVPSSTKGPYLRSGTVISASATAVPVAPAELLASLNGLLDSIPKASLRTVLSELDAGFSGTGPDLAKLLDSTSTLVTAADESLTQTTALIRDGATVLQTQNDASNSILSFSKDLRLLTAQLKESDPDLRRLVNTAPALATQAIALLRESGPGLSQLTADLLTVGRLAEPRNAGLRQLLVAYPALARAAYSAVPGDGTAHFGLVLNAFDPLPCIQGYDSTNRRPGSDISDVPVNAKATCTLSQGNPSTVRGSQNVPRGGRPGAPAEPSRSYGKTAGGRTVTVTPELLAELRALLQGSPALVTDPTQIISRSAIKKESR